MEKVLYAIISTIILVVLGLIVTAFSLSFDKLFVDYIFEMIVVIFFTSLITVIICQSFLRKRWGVQASRDEKKKLQADIEHYKKRLAELSRVDDKIKLNRAIHQFEMDNNIEST